MFLFIFNKTCNKNWKNYYPMYKNHFYFHQQNAMQKVLFSAEILFTKFLFNLTILINLYPKKCFFLFATVKYMRKKRAFLIILQPRIKKIPKPNNLFTDSICFIVLNKAIVAQKYFFQIWRKIKKIDNNRQKKNNLLC